MVKMLKPIPSIFPGSYLSSTVINVHCILGNKLGELHFNFCMGFVLETRSVLGSVLSVPLGDLVHSYHVGSAGPAIHLLPSFCG